MTPLEASQFIFNILWSVAAIIFISILAAVGVIIIAIVRMVRESVRQMEELWMDVKNHTEQFLGFIDKLGKFSQPFKRKKKDKIEI